ncbi:hypothetical protein MJO29_004209 [Puccinia striiformis f. sp. tritici]|nr:hypothetical protein MJO29_004209 [Puccinia striiformis f. sp. tritici]
MTGCGAFPSEALPPGWHWSGSAYYKSRPIRGSFVLLTNRSSITTNQQTSTPNNKQFFRHLSSRQDAIHPRQHPLCTLAAPAPITAQTDTFKQAPSLEKRLYLGGGLGGNLLGTGFVGGFNGYSPLGYAPQYISTSASGANSVYSANSAINSTPWGTTANSNQYSAQNTWANSNTAYRYPYFNGGFMILHHISPSLLASTPFPRPKPLPHNTYQPNFLPVINMKL